MTLKSHLFKQVPHLFLEIVCSHFSGSWDGSKTFYVINPWHHGGRPDTLGNTLLHAKI